MKKGFLLHGHVFLHIKKDLQANMQVNRHLTYVCVCSFCYTSENQMSLQGRVDLTNVAL